MQTITGDKTDETFNAQDGVSYNGQGGTDTLVFSGSFASYDIDLKDTGNIKTDVSWADGALDTKWIEQFVFADGVYTVATDEFVATNPTISISDGQAIEGQAVNFTISLSHATDHDVTVTYFTQQGSATGMGTDYFGTAGTQVTIPAGQTSVQISIQTRQDTLVEANEQFFVNLTSPTGATIADGHGVGTILNDDVAPPPPHITMTAVTSAVTEGGTISYLFERSGGDINSAFDVTWDYLPPLPSGAATPGVDFVDPASKVIHFTAGQTQATLNFVTIADGVYEGISPSLPSTEAFAITFVPDGSYSFSVNGTNIATIVDGDAPPAPLPTISISNVQVVEQFTQIGYEDNPYNGGTTSNEFGGFFPIDFTVMLSAPSNVPVTVNFTTPEGFVTDPGLATPGQDFIVTNGTITFQPGQTLATVRVWGADDFAPESSETFTVTLSNAANATIADVQGVATIIDNDVAPLPLISVVATDGVGTEAADGSPDFTFTFARTGDNSQELTVNYGVLPAPVDGATPGSDMAAQSGTITFAAGSATAVLSFDAIDDAVVENTELFSVVVGLGAGYDVDFPNATANATIIDNDVAPPLPTLSISDAAVNEEAGSMTFMVTLSAAAAGPVTFTYGTADGTAGSSDYVGVSNQIGTIGAGQTSTTVVISLTNDKLVETGGETFFVNLSNPVGATIADGQALGTILEQDQLIIGTPNPDTLIGGAGDDTIQGLAGNDRLTGGGGDDTIDGGDNLDIAVFSGAFTGPGAEYTITPGAIGGSSTVTDNVAGRDGVDELTNVELTEFSNTYVMNQRTLTVANFGGLTPGKQIFGTNNNVGGVGDNLTVAGNGNGRLIDLAGGGTDTLTLALGGTYNLNLARVEVIAGSGGNDVVTLQNAVSGMAVNLAGGSDTLNLANGGNNITVSGTESIHGGSGFDTVTLGDATPITINSIESVVGAGGDNQVTINADPGVTNVTASLNLDGGDDTVNLNFFGASTVANLALTSVEHLTSAGGVQTVNLSNDAGLTSVDLGTGFHTLNLASADHNLSVANVFTLNSFGSNNDTINFEAASVVNQTIDLGTGNDVLNFTGANDHLSMTIKGALLVHDQTTSGNLELNLLNQQAGSTYDLGAGTDTLHLNGNTGFVNVVSVQNVENVDSTGFGSDQIHILGNPGGTTTVTAGGGADLIWASADVDHFRFTSTGDSAFDLPGAGTRDVIHNFDAGEDKFVFDHIFGASSVDWVEIESGSTDIVLVDLNNDRSNDGMGNYSGYEMAIQLDNHVGTLTNANFELLV